MNCAIMYLDGDRNTVFFTGNYLDDHQNIKERDSMCIAFEYHRIQKETEVRT